jgi:phosphate transport system substrate-binding protein
MVTGFAWQRPRRAKVLKVNAKPLAPNIPQRPFHHRSLSYIWLALYFVLGLSGALATSPDTLVLVGSGSSVPAPLYARWENEYGKRHPGVQIRYVPSGTSAGIEQMSHGSGDFGAGEVVLTVKERADRSLIGLPTVLVAIVPIYNLPGLHGDLRLSGEVLAAIFLGDLKTWNAPQIRKLNPDIALPDIPIYVVNRPHGKGSNYIFTDFLSRASSKFRVQIGTTVSPHWLVGTTAERSSDMAAKVTHEPGSIGYVELRYAVRDNIAQAAVLNPAGRFVKASHQSISAACQAAGTKGWKSFSVSLINTTGTDSFPISGFSWIYLRTKSADSTRGAALDDFLDWVYTDGQLFASQEGYVELPPPLLEVLRKRVRAH